MDGLKYEKIGVAHEDERRSLTIIKNGFATLQTKLLRIKKGSILGNHYHEYLEMFYLVEGRARYIFEDIKTKERQKIDLKEDQRIIIEPRIAHKAEFIEDTVMLEETMWPYISKEVNDHEYIID